MKLTGKTIKPEQIEKVNRHMGYTEGSRYLSNHGYAFYYNQITNNHLDICDADRYANLNTILGYDVGIRKFHSLDSWLWEHDYDLMDLCGSDDDKKMLQEAARKTKTNLDFSKWRNLRNIKYTYLYFERGKAFK